MEVIGTTDVEAGYGRLLRGTGAGLALQPILQNGLERRVRTGVDLQSPAARRVQAFGSELVGQPDDAEATSVALFWMLSIAHDHFCKNGDIRPDTGGAGGDALWRPVLAEPVVSGHVVTLCGMLPVS